MMREYKARVKKSNFRDDLVKFLGFDCDVSGENGEEYLWEESKKKGYDNNAEYTVDKMIGVYGESNYAIKESLKQVLQHCYYTDRFITVDEKKYFYNVCLEFNHQ